MHIIVCARVSGALRPQGRNWCFELCAFHMNGSL